MSDDDRPPEDPDERDGGAGVREPRRPLPSAPSATVTQELEPVGAGPC